MSYGYDSMIFAIMLSAIGGLIVGIYARFKRRKHTVDAEEKDQGWRTQDWIWLICFLLYAQVFTVLYKDMVMGVVSYVSTFVSIALGAVAIYISVKEATKGDDVKNEINRLLGGLREKLDQMDVKMNRFDAELFARNTKIDEQTEKFVEGTKEDLPEKETFTRDQVIEIVNEQVKKAADGLKASLNFEEPTIFHPNRSVDPHHNLIFQIVNDYKLGATFTEHDIYDIVRNTYMVNMSVGQVYNTLMNLLNRGYLARENKSFIKKKTVY